MTQVVLSPCVGICTVNPEGLCEGCFRTLHEIGHWLNYTPAQREHLMDSVLPEREQNL
jgi:uncharacterized protein